MGDPAFSVGLSTLDDPRAAAWEAAGAARAALGEVPATLVLVFASPDLALGGEEVLPAVHAALEPETLLGAMGETVIAAGREIEDGPALAVWAAHLPGARITPFRLSARLVDDAVAVEGWPGRPSAAPEDPLLLLADPFTFPADALLGEVNAAEAGGWVIGGLASGAREPGGHRLFFQDEVLREGAVGAILAGVPVRPVVSQGCEPIGPEMVITAGGGQMVEELAGMAALDKLRGVIDDLEPQEREMASRGLLAGLVINENQPEYRRGDFLIRGIQGGDRETGALVVGERVRVGQTMRFHVRDAASADVDLRAALRHARESLAGARPAGGLVFSCNGRGTHMFPQPDHDASAIAEELQGVPTAGMFCNGEIGPVGGKSFLHGFTATMALFSLPSEQ
jgi:small ligand-binding sensory domain FIST